MILYYTLIAEYIICVITMLKTIYMEILETNQCKLFLTRNNSSYVNNLLLSKSSIDERV